jgi:cysteine synthase B
MASATPHVSSDHRTLAARAESVADLIGNTPLLDLTGLADELPDTVDVYGKAEFMNPGGSVKDRPAHAMIQDGLSTGAFDRQKTLIDATSGNTGIAYAMLGAALGLSITLAMPENATEERKKTLRAYGAELILTEAMEGTDGAQRVVREIVDEHPDRYFYPDQYTNDANWKSHYTGTGAEIINQTEGAVTHFVAGLGTTGTFVGTSRRLKAYSPEITCVALQPNSPLHGIEGMKHLETAMTPGIYDPSTADETIFIDTDTAYEMTRRLAREGGIFGGVSAGAAVAATLRVARTLDTGTLITILPDGGTRYLSEEFWTNT